MILELAPVGVVAEVANEELGTIGRGVVGASTATATATATVSTTTEAAGLAILTDKDGPSVELGVLELTDGAGGILGLLVLDNAAALGATVGALEDISLVDIAGLAHVLFCEDERGRKRRKGVSKTKLSEAITKDQTGRDPGSLPITHILEVLPGGLVRKIANVDVASTAGSSEATGTARGLTVLADKNHTALDLGVGQGLDGLLGLFGGGEFDDSTSLGSAVALLHDIAVNNLSGLTPGKERWGRGWSELSDDKEEGKR